MFGLGWPEVGIIAIAAVVIFGPKKIPEMGRALGKTLKGFKEEMNTPTSEQDTPDEEQPVITDGLRLLMRQDTCLWWYWRANTQNQLGRWYPS